MASLVHSEPRAKIYDLDKDGPYKIIIFGKEKRVRRTSEPEIYVRRTNVWYRPTLTLAMELLHRELHTRSAPGEP